MVKRIYINGKRTDIEIVDEPTRSYGRPDPRAGWIWLFLYLCFEFYFDWPILRVVWVSMKLGAYLLTGGIFWASPESFGL